MFVDTTISREGPVRKCRNGNSVHKSNIFIHSCLISLTRTSCRDTFQEKHHVALMHTSRKQEREKHGKPKAFWH